MSNERIEKLKDAVWKTWLRSVNGAMGCGTPMEVVREYGFTGDFAGLNQHFKNPFEIADALEDVQESTCMKCGEPWRKHCPVETEGLDCPPIS